MKNLHTTQTSDLNKNEIFLAFPNSGLHNYDPKVLPASFWSAFSADKNNRDDHLKMNSFLCMAYRFELNELPLSFPGCQRHFSHA